MNIGSTVPPMNVIECSHISKVFPGTDAGGRGETHALEDISIHVEKGNIVGLLGPDGAGKTTLMRILTGLMAPTSGDARVLGFSTVRDCAKITEVIGYMPQKFGLYENLTVEENLTLYARLHDVKRSEQEERFAQLLKMTDLTPFRKRMAENLSGGMKQKLALACALSPRPKLMLLDEPTVGVDVLSRHELWQILRKIVNEGETTVFVSTAYMDEADFCDRTLVLFGGKLLADASPAEIRALAASHTEHPTFENGFQVLLTGSVPPPLVRRNPPAHDAPVRIHTEGLVKRFGVFTAVNHISFDVRKGEIFGLLGANGAGKTTTFRMLCGLSSSDGGTLEIGGVNLRRAPGRARKKIGFVAQKFSLYTDLSVRNNLEFFGGVYGLSGKRLRERIRAVVEEFSLHPFLDAETARLPLGFKQCLSMACALLHEPEIVFLDEATSGADPMARREFWARIMKLADDGASVIITTHFLDEAAYCDRMLILQDGTAAASGTAVEILSQGTFPELPVPETLEDAFVNIIQNTRNHKREAVES